MNIVVISNSYPNRLKPYAGHHVRRHVAMHREAGVVVRVLQPGESRSGLFFTTWKYFRLWLMVVWTAVSQPIDLVHAHWVLPSGLFGAFLAAVRRKPFVVTSHGAFTNTFGRRNGIIRFLVRLVLGRADRIIGVGSEQQARIEAIAGLAAGSVECINMGVLIADTAVSREEARQELKLPQDEQVVIFIGNLLKRKGPDLLVKAVAALEDRAGLRVYIGGQGPERAALAAQIEALGLAGVVALIGPIEPEAVYSWLGAADICVVPSRTEPFGLVAIEALASGTPVIAANVGGLTESVRDGFNGLLFPVDDDEALAECLKRLLADLNLRARMAAAARGSVGRYDMRLQASKVMAIYEEFLTEKDNSGLGKLKWYANRLLSMGLGEVGYRLGSQVTLWRERSAVGRPGHDYTPYPLPDEIFLKFKEKGWPQFFFGGEDEVGRREQIQSLFPEGVRATMETAELLLKDQITLFGRPLALDNPIQWSKDLLTGKVWPQDFWAAVDVRDGRTVGGVKWVRELNRCHHFVTLGKAYWLSSEERFAEALCGQLGSWIEANPPFVGVNWSSALGNSIRVINWICAMQFVHRSPALTEALFGRIMAALAAQTAFIGRHLSRYSSANNHLIGEAAGLAFAGLSLPWLQEARGWAERGLAILTEEIGKQIYPDGVPAEQAVNYLAFDLDFYLLVWQGMTRKGLPVPAVWQERLGAACDFMGHIMDEVGQVPAIGDSDDGRVVALDERPEANPFRSILASAAVLLERPDLKAWAGKWDEKSHWLLGEAGREKFEGLEKRPLILASKAFKRGGYGLMRRDDRLILFDWGPLGYLSLAAHGHADALSLLLTVEGQPVLIDPGTYAYREGGAWRRYFRGTSAHNSIVVDGLDQSEMRGDFLWGRRAAVRLLDWQTNDEFDLCTAEHDGYAPLNIIHRRRVLFDKPDWILVEDWLAGAGVHRVEQSWHFPIGTQIDKIAGHFMVNVKNTAVQILTDQPAMLAATVITGESSPIQGWVSEGYGQKKPAPVLLVSGSCSLPLKITTLFNLGRPQETAELIKQRDRLANCPANLTVV